ncbi:PEP motif putative anchor domain protein (plasmid) [Gemmatirosa kalamazoonensis]|uniref:PEP motif putative anchor domain protein n=1 Tax=Gemmatirosa kalamazoonensis TaxID=861299 RepID=W0RPV3_9BACT|nr:PEP-CTERM sorting domain-containing protein [Gemmatirosa kalamazoonensis]AHG92522.1 PEP motif putative anchor domain protein [Gemmatirosa kalamazoonensis]
MRHSIVGSTIVTLALVVPCTARGQVLSGAAGGNGFDFAPNCSNPIATVVAPIGQTICTGPGANGVGNWDASFGALHVFAEVDATSALPSIQYLTMSALGRLDDPLVFTGVRPSTVVVSLQETWTQGSSYMGLGPNAFTSELTVGGAYFCTNDYLASYAAGSFSQGRSVSCEIPSTGLLTLSYQISAFATIANPSYPTLAPFSGTTITDASHTGLITGLTFFDAAGNDITSSVTYTTGSGARYQGLPTATAPEPAPGLLVGTGMLAVGVVVTRRRRCRVGPVAGR